MRRADGGIGHQSLLNSPTLHKHTAWVIISESETNVFVFLSPSNYLRRHFLRPSLLRRWETIFKRFSRLFFQRFSLNVAETSLTYSQSADWFIPPIWQPAVGDIIATCWLGAHRIFLWEFVFFIFGGIFSWFVFFGGKYAASLSDPSVRTSIFLTAFLFWYSLNLQSSCVPLYLFTISCRLHLPPLVYLSLI